MTNACQTSLGFHRQVVGKFTNHQNKVQLCICFFFFWKLLVPCLLHHVELLLSCASILGLASVLPKELTLVTHSVMRRGSVHVKGMSLGPNVHSARQAFMDWRVQTHMDVNSASVMDTAVSVRQLWGLPDITFQISSHQVGKVGLLSMSKVRDCIILPIF